MPRTDKGKRQAKKMTAYQTAARRVAVILNDPETPQFLHDVLTDMVVTLSNVTNADLHHPAIVPMVLEIGLRESSEEKMRQYNGHLSREGQEEVVSNASN